MRVGSFHAQMRRYRVNTLVDVDRLRRAVALKLFSAVVMDTPVATGRARANWRASINHTIDVADDSTNFLTEMSRTEAIVGKSTGADELWLSNSLPYIARLEYDGWSKQAPQGMVRKNVARFQRLIKAQLRKAGLR